MHQMRYRGPWRVGENFRGCGMASEGVVSDSDEGVWALQLVVTTSAEVISDSENILRTSKGLVRT